MFADVAPMYQQAYQSYEDTAFSSQYNFFFDEDSFNAECRKIKKLNGKRFINLWEKYGNAYSGPYFSKYSQNFTHKKSQKIISLGMFLEKFANVENLDFDYYFPDDSIYQDLCSTFSKLPKLKKLKVREEFGEKGLNWIKPLSSLEKFSFISWNKKKLDLSPTKDLKKLKFLKVKGIKVLENLDLLPKSIISLDLQDCKINSTDFLERLELKKLNLSYTKVSHLPSSQVLSKLEFLDISGTKIYDLSSLKDNNNLKILNYYCNEKKTRKKTDFYVINTLINLEELDLSPFPGTNEQFKNAIENCTRLRECSVEGPLINDLSPLIGKPLQVLNVSSVFFNNNRDSLEKVLNNPSLNELIIYVDEDEELEQGFNWNSLSSNIKNITIRDSETFDLNLLPSLQLEKLHMAKKTKILHPEKILSYSPTLTELAINGNYIYFLLNTYGEEVFQNFSQLKVLKLKLNENFTSLEFLTHFPALEEVTLNIKNCNESLLDEFFPIFLKMPNLKKFKVYPSPDFYQKINELEKKGVPIKIGYY